MEELIEVSKEQQHTLVQNYVKNLLPVSQSIFVDRLAETNDIKQSLYEAILNESINRVLEQFVEEHSK